MRRIGSTPAERGSVTGANCPDVIEADDGDFLVIGRRPIGLRNTIERYAPEGASVGEDEDVVLVPRRVLLDAARQLHEEGLL